MKNKTITPELQCELRRRWADRNVKGYWGVNARAWIRHHIRYVRMGFSDGFTVSNQSQLVA